MCPSASTITFTHQDVFVSTAAKEHAFVSHASPLDLHKRLVSVNWQTAAAASISLVTLLSIKLLQHSPQNPSVVVWWYGWVTALSTGLGALPLLFFKRVNKWWTGASNAVAAGMMISTSVALICEGFELPATPGSVTSESVRVVMGMLLGLLFILISERFLESHEDVKHTLPKSLDARKAMLVFTVMFLHSFSEGVGIGVSFEAEQKQLGLLVSATLAVHNIPEGFAVGVAMVPQGVTVLQAAVWGVLSSLPQPVMAVVANLFVEQFVFILPMGLGFAAGAMIWVAYSELLQDAARDTSVLTTGTIAGLAGMLMWGFQQILKEHI